MLLQPAGCITFCNPHEQTYLRSLNPNLASWLAFSPPVLPTDSPSYFLLAARQVNSMLEGGSWVDWNDGRTT